MFADFPYSQNSSRASRWNSPKITARGQTTIPKSIREAANLAEGDVIAFEIEGDHVVVYKGISGRDDYLEGLSKGSSEWNSPEDEEAWREL